MSGPRGIEIEFANRQQALPISVDKWRSLILLVLESAKLKNAELSVTIVDDREMHQLNRQYLQHDYPTDVLSFVLEQSSDWLVGQIIVSAETAVARASEFGWSPDDELTMYVLHGSLHLVGYDDKDPVAREFMRSQEVHFLKLLGIEPRVRPTE